jgi:hypothetical protein
MPITGTSTSALSDPDTNYVDNIIVADPDWDQMPGGYVLIGYDAGTQPVTTMWCSDSGLQPPVNLVQISKSAGAVVSVTLQHENDPLPASLGDNLYMTSPMSQGVTTSWTWTQADGLVAAVG